MNKICVVQKSLDPPIEALWGDGSCDDSPAIRSLLRGHTAFDIRAGKMLSAPTLKDLPPGLYRLVPSVNPATPGH